MQLLQLNPWWENKANIDNDKHIKALSKFKYVYEPELLKEQFKKGNVYSIRGPRQIGKTTFLKLLIRKELEEHPHKNLFYWSCDNLNSKNELIDLVKEYADYCRINDAQPDFILLDEITSIKEWQNAIKFIIDNDIVEESCFVLTGSNAIDIKKGTERLPGRRGKHGKDFFYMPLTFRRYVKLLEPEWFKRHEKDSVEKLKFHSDKLRILFNRYLLTGGIPLVINEYERDKEIQNYIYDLYYSWIVGDVLKEGKNEQTLKEIMKGVLMSYATPISWDSLAKRSSIKSHLTVSSYIELLSHLLVSFSTFFFDVDQSQVNYNKNKKIYFYDPFILDVFSKRLNINVDKSKIIEGIVGADIKQENILQDVFFTVKKKETDFVMGRRGIEVKYQNKISKEDFYNKKYFREYTILSKELYDKNVVPVHIFLFVRLT